MEILDKIASGEITVKWNSWSFAGGRDWGDWHSFKLYKGNEYYGWLNLRTDDLTFSIGEDISTVELSEEESDKAYDILLDAVRRDDSDLISKLKGNNLPSGYDDISREDVLMEKWKGEDE